MSKLPLIYRRILSASKEAPTLSGGAIFPSGASAALSAPEEVDSVNGQIGESLSKTGADIGYVGAAIGNILSNPDTYRSAAKWAGQNATDLWLGKKGLPTPSEAARGAALGVLDTGNFILDAATHLRPGRIQHLLETGQSLFSGDDFRYAPGSVYYDDARMKRRAEAAKWLEDQGPYSEVTRLATGFLSPI